MLGKLMKYEFLVTGRTLLPIYGAVLLFSVVHRLLVNPFGTPFGTTSAAGTTGLAALTFFYVMAMFAGGIITTVVIIRRFYKNTLRDEGYLTHTLPVSVSALIWGKLIPAFCWTIVGFLVLMLNFAIIFAHSWIFEFFQFDIWRYFFDMFRWNMMMTLSLLTVIASLLTGILGFYCALALGHLMRRAKILWAVIYWMIMNFIFSLISGMFTEMFFSAPSEYFLVSLALAGTLARGAIFYALTHSILRAFLNLE